FFVTPHIMHDEDFADLAEISYRKKLEAADTIGLDRMRMVDPDFGGDSDTIDLEGFDLPLYAKPQRGEVKASDVGMDPLSVHETLRKGREKAAEERAAKNAEDDEE
ncbi:MAG: hypothetical protein VCD16_06820, partial [Planctomycetota bacterium]